jgi:glycosyltransferase involved in cell wall biosynthesis
MDYMVLTRNDVATIRLTIASIRNQSNVNRIVVILSASSSDGTAPIVDELHRKKMIDKVIIENQGLTYGRRLAIEEAETDFFAFVDADVILSPQWAERMWMYISESDKCVGAAFGALYRNKAHEAWLRETERVRTIPVGTRMYTHNTFVRSRSARGWSPKARYDGYEDYLVTRHIQKSDCGDVLSLPVISEHRHKGSVVRSAVWAGAGARVTGYHPTLRSVIRRALIRAGVGLKRSMARRELWFFLYAAQQGMGMIWGYVGWKKYLGAIGR